MEAHDLSPLTSGDEDVKKKSVANTLCKICARTLSLNSRRKTQMKNVFKSTIYCKDHGPVHIACAVKFCSVIKSDYQYENQDYELDDSMPLYCRSCEKPCFFCHKNHTLGHNHVKIHVCPQCKKIGVIVIPTVKLTI